MSLIGVSYRPVTPFTGRYAQGHPETPNLTRLHERFGPNMYQTDQAWWTVDAASRVLRVNRKTLYDACASGDFPHIKVGPYVRIPCEALRMRLAPEIKERSYNIPDDAAQLELPLDPACLIPVKMYRNGGRVLPWAYEHALWRVEAP